MQLAVGAYIRHKYTDYDKYLRDGGKWPQARQRVHDTVYNKLREWRDEADSDPEFEETFREIIVLDDDDDDDDTDEDGSDASDESLEIIASRAPAHELQPERLARRPDPEGDVMSPASRRRIYAQPVHYPAPTTTSNDTYVFRQVIGSGTRLPPWHRMDAIELQPRPTLM